ncbi:hypothetical protein [Zoogloea sp.]|uniref:hypothetical protein n=1 Tax=Zoogloea sp. TaxID=49181 RepID=UPI0035B31345
MPPGELPVPGRAGAALLAFVLSLGIYLVVMTSIHMAAPGIAHAEYTRGSPPAQDVVRGKLVQRSYGDVHVRIEKHRGGPKPIFKGIGWLALFIACFIAIRRSPALKAFHATLSHSLRRIHPIEFAGFLLAALLIYGKPGIIDMIPLGEVIGGIREGINFYTISTLQGQDGHLPIFPYNPPAYFLLGILSEAHGVLTSLGLPPPQPHALLQLLLFLVYAGLAANLSRIATDLNLPLLRGRKLYYFILLNPLGLYYTVLLGQIDLIAIALLMAGLHRLHAHGARGSAFLLLLAGLTFAKPQHLLALPALLLLGIGLSDPREARRNHLFVTALAVACVLTYLAFTLAPGFYTALGSNPQAPRLAWSTWWTMLSDAIVINRPIAYALISSLLLVYLMPERVRSRQDLIAVGALGMAFTVASFQASFAHTFGLAIFLYPAVIFICLGSTSLLKASLLSTASLGLVAAWGTGPVGDFTAAFGLQALSSLPDSVVAGIRYPSLIHSIETSLYLGFALLFILQLSRTRTTTMHA